MPEFSTHRPHTHILYWKGSIDLAKEHYERLDILSLTEASDVFGISVKAFRYNFSHIIHSLQKTKQGTGWVRYGDLYDALGDMPILPPNE